MLGGFHCRGQSYEFVACNTHPCHGKYLLKFILYIVLIGNRITHQILLLNLITKLLTQCSTALLVVGFFCVVRHSIVCVYIYIYNLLIYLFHKKQAATQVGHHGHIGVIARLPLALESRLDTEIAFLPMPVLLEEMNQSHV